MMNGVLPRAWPWLRMKAVPEPALPSSSSVSTRTVENSSFFAMESISMGSDRLDRSFVEALDRAHRRALRLLRLGLGAHHGQAAERAESLDVHQGDVCGLLGFVGRIDDIARRLDLQDEHALAGQDHRALAQLSVDQRGVVGGDGADDLVPRDLAAQP